MCVYTNTQVCDWCYILYVDLQIAFLLSDMAGNLFLSLTL